MATLTRIIKDTFQKHNDEIDNKDNKEKEKDPYDFMNPRNSTQTSPSPPASPRNVPTTITGLNKEKQRRLTFSNWNCPTTDKFLLAQIGFYFIGPTDLVKCYFCNVEIGMWQPEDNPVEEHLRWSPNCPLLHGRETISKCGGVAMEEPKTAAVSDSKMCKICYECEYNTAFFPCGHIIACAKCASSVTKCPYCRQPFTKVMRVYFS
uniref:CSON007018 protein n=1 Tax=Culicoides sonorensis TaxID=179676 RepID=A0A336LXC9_CULSO